MLLDNRYVLAAFKNPITNYYELLCHGCRLPPYLLHGFTIRTIEGILRYFMFNNKLFYKSINYTISVFGEKPRPVSPMYTMHNMSRRFGGDAASLDRIYPTRFHPEKQDSVVSYKSNRGSLPLLIFHK